MLKAIEYQSQKTYFHFYGLKKIKIKEEIQENGNLYVTYEELKEPEKEENSLQINMLREEFKKLKTKLIQYDEMLKFIVSHMDATKPSFVNARSIAFILGSKPEELQELLVQDDPEKILRMSKEILKNSLETKMHQQNIKTTLELEIPRELKKKLLMEELNAIEKELGLKNDEKTTLIEKLNQKLIGKTLSETAKNVFEEEINKLRTLEISSAEYNVTRNYLEWLCTLPWGLNQKEVFDVNSAEKILDEDHYGMKKIKERILEFVAVGKMKNTVQGKIILLVGPPGTGKTSIGKSIARALGREFFRFSVGGLSETGEIKGHRRTYIGAMPGKIIQILKLAKSLNPIIMIDEIDKLGRGNYHGDPGSALLEVLDPEQNNAFLDHYLDIPFDLSKVLFICTANSEDTIPRPLLDRMEKLTLSGYILEEKMNIAKQYLIPKIIKEVGIKKIKLSDQVLEKLIREYCREAGVRNLEKHLEQIARKIALIHAQDETLKPIDAIMLEKMIGLPHFTTDRYYEETPIGVTMGLAWTEMGGSTLYIETKVVPTKENSNASLMLTTGKMGETMKESSTISYTFAKNFLLRKFPDNQFFKENSIHLHVPEGATPKDGPSAGVTMVTSLLSLALNQPVKKDLAMTGEISLTGLVLEIGGVKEKTIAARRSGAKELIFPHQNKKNWNELEKEIQEGLKVHFVKDYSEVFDIAFEKTNK